MVLLVVVVVVVVAIFVFVASAFATAACVFLITDTPIGMIESNAPDTIAAVAGDTCIGTVPAFVFGIATGVSTEFTTGVSTEFTTGVVVSFTTGVVVSFTTGVVVVNPYRNENPEKNRTKIKIPDKKKIGYKFRLFITLI